MSFSYSVSDFGLVIWVDSSPVISNLGRLKTAQCVIGLTSVVS